MKKIISVLCVAATFVFVACQQPVKGKNGVTYTSALQYNDYILNKQSEIIELIIQYSKASQTDLDKADVIIDTAVATCTRYISDVEGMPDWKGNTSFRNDAPALLKFYKKTFSDDYQYIIDMQKDGTVSKEEEAQYNKIMDGITKNEGQLDDNMKKSQQDFAAANNFKLERAKIQDKIDQMSTK